MHNLISSINDIVLAPVLMVLLLGTGLYLSIGLRFVTLRNIGPAFAMMLRKQKKEDEGQISPFGALMTALSATIGTGNIAGVATALVLGGPGALFWMWITALFGMATKFTETVCAVRFREVDAAGNYSGGPMYYIKNGLHKRWHWLGFLFAVFGSLAGFGLANTVQSNSVAQVLESTFNIPALTTGLVLMVLVGCVILGGINRIAQVVSVVVPFMAISYLLCGLTVVALNISAVPAAIMTIIDSAMNGAAAAGGFAGASVWAALRFGVARGIFSNEAGLGSAPIAHAAARTNQPVRQGLIAMLGTFIDTLIVCSVTGIVIVVTGVLPSGATGAALTASAFSTAFPGGDMMVAIALVIFAFTTMIGWSYYGERCVVYLVGVRGILPFRLLWVIAIPIGTIVELELIWIIADVLNALMALPNLLALLLLSPLVFAMTRDHFSARSGR